MVLKLRYVPALEKRGYVVSLVDGYRLKIIPTLSDGLAVQVAENRDLIVLELAQSSDNPRGLCRFCKAEVVLIPYAGGEGLHWYCCPECEECATAMVNPSYYFVDSALFGEVVAVGSDWPRRRGLVGYSEAEVAALKGKSPELLKAIHRLKKSMPGVSCEAGEDGFWYEVAAKQMTMEAAA